MRHPEKRYPPLAKNIASGNGQSDDGNFFRFTSCGSLVGNGPRNGRSPLLQALTGDSAPCVDSARYCRHRLQKFDGALETPGRVFLEEYLNENNDWLRDIFELFER